MKIKGYEIEQVLADREDLTIAKAIQTSLDRPVFLKILKELKTEPEVMERFTSEARLLAKLNHPNIVTVFDLDISESQAIIALEYFEGEDLASFAGHESLLDLEQLISISFQVLTGCAQAHERDIIHGDIKPENILINQDGLIKLTDFGLASILGQARGPVSGTSGFMAPELALGEPPSANTDIFAIGMTLYVMATGQNPLLGSDITESLNLSIQHDPEMLSELRDDLPESFVQLVHRMITKAPHERIKSCERALELLREEHRPPAVSGQDSRVTTQDNEVSSQARSYSVRRWSAIALSIPVILIISIFMFGWPWTIRTEKFSEVDPPSITNSRIAVDSLEALRDEETTKAKAVVMTDAVTPTAVDPVADFVAEVEEPENTSLGVTTDSVGRLYLAASPWAEIHIDGMKIGVTPIVEPVTLGSGDHIVQFLHPDYPDLLKNVRIKPGEVDSLTLNWSKSLGFLRVTVNPWAEVFINSRSYDLTPLARPIPLQPGEFQLFLKNPDFPPWNQFLSVAAGDTLNVNVRLQKPQDG